MAKAGALGVASDWDVFLAGKAPRGEKEARDRYIDWVY